MGIRGQVKIAVAGAVVGAAAVTLGVAVVVHRIRRRRHHKGQFLSEKKRRVIRDAIRLSASDVPHGPVGASLFRSHLEGLSDKRLLVLYAAVKVGEYVRDAGIDPLQITTEQLEGVRSRFVEAEASGNSDREGMLATLTGRDFADVKPLLVLALAVLALI